MTSLICGIDEAGRGPLAGPVCAAAVILNSGYSQPEFPIDLLNDSKKLNVSDREKARVMIMENTFAWGIGWATHEEIDKINILQASLLAMKRAFEDMLQRAASDNKALPLGEIKAIADGTFTPDIPVKCQAMIKADAQIAEVMAASILAKTERDIYMDKMAALYPQYGYEKHKGYPTKAHREAICKYGPSPIQRMSFRVKKEERL